MRIGAAAGWLLVASLGALASVATVRRASTAAPPIAFAPALDDRERYAGSDSCRACHPAAYATWHDSFHRTMTQRAGPESILASFDGRALDDAGRYRVEREGDAFFVRGPGPNRRRVVLVTGSHHMQVYWTEPDVGGRLEAFAFAYLLPEQRWVPNEATLLRPPVESDVLRGEAPDSTFTWNRVCIKCHAVAGVPGYSEQTDVASTRVVELGIACESCHGPGAAHVEANRNPARRYALHLRGEGDATVMHPHAVDPSIASQACAQCHAITEFHDDAAWVERGHEAAPPDPIAAWGSLVEHPVVASTDLADRLLDDDPDFFADRYWSDGMVRVSGREYNGLVRSPCAADESFSCLTCHRMHASGDVDGSPWRDDQLEPGAREGEVCLSCHQAIASDVVAHTHHPADSTGSRCVDCHMPHTTYGLLKAIRSHTIDSPDVSVSLQTGRPNACNLCHLDRSSSWSADWLERWYGIGRPDEVPAEHAASVEWLIAGDAGQRALLAWHLGWTPAIEASGATWQVPLLATLLDDPYAAVRIVAARSLAQFMELDDDPLRAEPGVLAAEVAARWAESHADAPARPEVFVTQGARADAESLAPLRARRDDRPVSLEE
jgi:hypothetical protein